MALDQEEIRLTLRLPAILRDRILGKASESGRSLNAEMVYRLEKTLEDENKASLEARVAELEESLNDLYVSFEKMKHRVGELDMSVNPDRYDWK